MPLTWPSAGYLNKIKNHNEMKILKLNPKIALIASLISMVFLLQNCKKAAAVSPTKQPLVGAMVAYINDTAWIGTKIEARIAFNVADSSKSFYIYGVSGNKAIDLLAGQAHATNTPGFPLNNNNDSPVFDLSVQQTPGGVYLLDRSTVGTSSGASLFITAVDTVNQTISGTFSFPAFKNIYDSNGYVTSEKQFAEISSGKFTSVPYSYSVLNLN
jgi:hypothetical protein